MDTEKLAYLLLWASIEDYVGLWELLWEIDSASSNDLEANKGSAKKFLLYSLNTNLIKCYYNRWGNDQIQEIGRQEAIEIIEGDRFWLAPELGDLCVKLGSTEKGEMYYNESLIDNRCLE